MIEFFFHDDTAETITAPGPASHSSEIAPYDTAFYTNQEEDPQVQALLAQEMMNDE